MSSALDILYSLSVSMDSADGDALREVRERFAELIAAAERAQKALPVLRTMLEKAGLAGADTAAEHDAALRTALARVQGGQP